MKMRLFYQILALILAVLLVPALLFDPWIGLAAMFGMLAFVAMSAYAKE